MKNTYQNLNKFEIIIDLVSRLKPFITEPIYRVKSKGNKINKHSELRFPFKNDKLEVRKGIVIDTNDDIYNQSTKVLYLLDDGTFAVFEKKDCSYFYIQKFLREYSYTQLLNEFNFETIMISILGFIKNQRKKIAKGSPSYKELINIKKSIVQKLKEIKAYNTRLAEEETKFVLKQYLNFDNDGISIEEYEETKEDRLKKLDFSDFDEDMI